MVYHVATFKIVDTSRAQEAADALWRLKDIVPRTIDYKVGINFKETPATAAVCIVGIFDNKEHLEEYMNHPIHTDEVAPVVAELCDYEIIERMVSCDFEV